jgi:hypothetical protein
MLGVLRLAHDHAHSNPDAKPARHPFQVQASPVHRGRARFLSDLSDSSDLSDASDESDETRHTAIT